MLEPLIWMFKNKDFIKHYFLLLIISLFIPVIIVFSPNFSFNFPKNFNINNIEYLIQLFYFLLLMLPFLIISGYFWNLADNIANREIDITASNIYDGKIAIHKYFNLPDIDILKLIWRGISSIISIALLFSPFIAISLNSAVDFQSISDFWGWENLATDYLSIILLIFIFIFLPALLWNYARRDSIIAILNIPLAVYIYDNFKKTYFLNYLYFFIVAVIYFFIVKYTALGLGINSITSIQINSVNKFSFFIFCIAHNVLGIYLLFINAFLLGTIVPPSEA